MAGSCVGALRGRAVRVDGAGAARALQAAQQDERRRLDEARRRLRRRRPRPGARLTRSSSGGATTVPRRPPSGLLAVRDRARQRGVAGRARRQARGEGRQGGGLRHDAACLQKLRRPRSVGGPGTVASPSAGAVVSRPPCWPRTRRLTGPTPVRRARCGGPTTLGPARISPAGRRSRRCHGPARLAQGPWSARATVREGPFGPARRVRRAYGQVAAARPVPPLRRGAGRGR